MTYFFNMVCFLIFFHVAFFLVKDVIQYHSKHKIKVSRKVFKIFFWIIFSVFFEPFVVIFLQHLFHLTIVQQFIISLLCGGIFLRVFLKEIKLLFLL